MKETVLKLTDIKPYPNNPRDNRNAIEPVKESIRRFGYVTPIVVDKNHVIIAGHTRFLALQQLGHTEAPVIISDMSPAKAKEFRLVDNKSSEVAQWDRDKLISELRTIEGDMGAFFQKSDLTSLMGNIDDIAKKGPGAKEIEEQGKKVQQHFQNLSQRMAEKVVHVNCQHCGEKFGFDLI